MRYLIPGIALLSTALVFSFLAIYFYDLGAGLLSFVTAMSMYFACAFLNEIDVMREKLFT